VLLIVSTLTGACAALAAWLISRVTDGTVSPLSGVVIGLAFGFTLGNVSGRRPAERRSVPAALLRAVISGATAGLVLLLLQRQ
jgi:hypothetical protein